MLQIFLMKLLSILQLTKRIIYVEHSKWTSKIVADDI